MTLPPTLEEVRAEQARRKLSEFIRQAWPIVEPNTEYLGNWHIDAMCEYLEAVTLGQIKRLLINCPPRYSKSRTVSVCWPCWEWIDQPSRRYLFATYAAGLSIEHSIDRRTILQSAWYRSNWPHVVLAGDQNAKEEYRNTKQGRMIATSVHGTALGKGASRVVVDDPHNTKKAESDVERQSTLNQFDRGLSTRLNNKKQDAIVVVMQRLHEEDVSARCIELGYTHLCLQGEAEKRTIIVLPRSGRKIVREQGDLLWPEREGPAEIAAMKKSLQAYGYAGQYQQRPSPASGGILKRAWFRFWKPTCTCGGDPHVNVCPAKLPPVRDDAGRSYVCVELPAKLDEQIQSWDTSFKKYSEAIRRGKTPDPVSGGVLARLGADIFLLDRKNELMDVNEAAQAIVDMTAEWPETHRKLIEDKGNGPAIRAILKRKVSGLVGVNPIGSKVQRVITAAPTDDDKDARALAYSTLLEAGNIHLPHPAIAPWVWEFVESHVSFPNAAHDDDVDMMSQACMDFQRRTWSEADRDEIRARRMFKDGKPPETAQDAVKREIAKILEMETKPKRNRANRWRRRRHWY